MRNSVGIALCWRARALAVAAVVTTVALPAAAQLKTDTLGGREVAVWQPRDGTAGRHAVLIFSHGYGGCATQSKFLAEALAARGYWVFAPNHKDARCGRAGGASDDAARRSRGRARTAARPEAPFRDPDQWTDATYADRKDDIRAVQKAIGESADYASSVDLERLGYLGHSLGGYTVVGLAGGWGSWKTPGLKAVLALSPYVEPFLRHGSLGSLTAPVMYQGGTMDVGISPSLRKGSGAYDASSSPKYYVEFDGAGHFAWTDLRDSAHQDIVDYSLAFLDRYVRGAPASTILTQTAEGVAELRWQSELGTGQTKGTTTGRRGRRRPAELLDRPVGR